MERLSCGFGVLAVVLAGCSVDGRDRSGGGGSDTAGSGGTAGSDHGSGGTAGCGGSGPADAGMDLFDARDGAPVGPDASPPCEAGVNLPAPDVADWVRTARIGGTSLDPSMTDAQLRTLMTERQAQNVSVMELDSGLSYYLTDAQFDAQVKFLDRAARIGHELGMRSVIYYPSLEVLTKNAVASGSSMYKDHPDWVQVGISGEPNVFYGGLEHWVEPGTESAWMDPNSLYRAYFLGRIAKLAGTALDGLWADVPIYLETGTQWPGAGPHAAAAFRSWSAARGLGAGAGLDLPVAVDFADPVFRAWIRWRHENLDAFTADVQATAAAVNPDFTVIIETFPIDDMDGTTVGLDGSYRTGGHNFIRVWEVDSVSNSEAMKWSTIEDMSGKIAMFKWALAAERGNPAWVFSYGNQPLDASLVMAAAAAAGAAPFEAKTPDMTTTVGSSFRSSWFGFLREHTEALLKTPRAAHAGIWYSSPTRDYIDTVKGGDFGLYVTTTSPTNDPDWWAQTGADSALVKPHLGGWRAAVHSMIQLAMPWRPVLDGAGTEEALAGLSLVWMPNVTAISDRAAAALERFVAAGGVLLATGTIPGSLDELGTARPDNILASILGLAPGETAPVPREHTYGKGKAILRPDLEVRDVMTGFSGNAASIPTVLGTLGGLIRAHAPSEITVENPIPGLLVEVAHQSPSRSYVFVLNYTGLQLPLVSAPRDVSLLFRAPSGTVTAARAYTPDTAGVKGPLTVVPTGTGQVRLVVHTDQFAVVELDLAP